MNDYHNRLIHLLGRERGLDRRRNATNIVKLTELTWVHDCFGPHFLNSKSGRPSVFVFMDITVTGLLWFNISVENVTGLLNGV